MSTDFKVFLRHALYQLKVPAVIVGIAFILLFTSLGNFIEAFSAGREFSLDGAIIFFCEKLKGKEMLFILPIVCTIPYAAAFTEDVKNGFIKEILPRTHRREYIISKIAAAAISGGIVVTMGMFLYIIFSIISFSPIITSFSAYSFKLSLVQLFGIIISYFISSAFWASFGMLASAISLNIYVAYIVPFIAYYIMEILYQRYFTKAYILSPFMWANPSEDMPLGRLGADIMVTELLILTVIAFYLISKKRLENV